MNTFRKQFNDVIDKQLTKEMKPATENINDLKERYKRINPSKGESANRKLTLVIGLDGVLMKTSVFPKEIPHVDAQFQFNHITVYVCFRPHMREFIEECASRFELILWSSSPSDYTDLLFGILPLDL